MPPEDESTLITSEEKPAEEAKAAEEAKGTPEEKAAAEAKAAEEAKGTPEEKAAAEAKAAEEAKGTPEEKAAAEAKAAAEKGAPEKYADFTLPDGMEVDEALMGDFLPLAKEFNLTQAQAQQLIDLQTTSMEKVGTAQEEAWATRVKDWGEETKTDKEIGGDKLKENLGLAKRGLDAFGTPELGKLLDTTGLGNNLAFVRFFAKVGKEVADDNINPGNPSGEAVDPAKVLYPDMA